MDTFGGLANREQRVMSKRLKLIKAKTKITFLNTNTVGEETPSRLSPGVRKVKKQPQSPYSWRRKSKASNNNDIQLAANKMITFRLRKRIKRAMAALMTFIEFVNQSDLQSAIHTNQVKLQRVFDCENVCIFTKDLKGHLCLQTGKASTLGGWGDSTPNQHFRLEELHKIGE